MVFIFLKVKDIQSITYFYVLSLRYQDPALIVGFTMCPRPQ